MRELLYLTNILESINLIKQYIKSKKASDLNDSILLRDVICKRIKEIGENMKKISAKTKKSHPEVDWIAFIETRNFLIPILEKQIKEMLKEEIK